MATTIKLKNSTVTTTTPSTLAQGEVAINITDKKVWVGNAATTPVQIAGAGTTGTAAGSTGYVQFNTSGAFNGSANFFWDNTNNRLGLGTSSPSYPLAITHSSSAGGATEAALTITNTSTANSAQIQLIGGRSFSISANGSAGSPANGFAITDNTAAVNRLVITGAGDVGIGVSTTVAKLQVAGRAAVTSGDKYGLMLGYSTSATGYYYVGVTADSTPDLVFTNASVAETMRLTNAGDLGIGTTSPRAKLDVAGAVYSGVTGTAGDFVICRSSDGNAIGEFKASGDNVILNNAATSGVMIFNTNATERMRIDSSGNVLIGTTAPLVNSTGRGNITLNGTTDGIISYGIAGSTAAYLYVNSGVMIVNVQGSRAITFETAGAERMRVLHTGNILSLAGGSTTATGTGIAFPATQSASTDANTLDDYEEGTWTPSVGGTATYYAQLGKYTKIGNTVTVYYEIGITLIGTGQTFGITNLPFTSSSGAGMIGATGNHTSVATSHYSLYSYTDPSATNIYYGAMTALSGGSATPITAMQNNTYIRGAFTYFTA